MPGRLGLSMMAVQSYERLEWLGDAVLELTIRRLLMSKYPGSDEVREGACVCTWLAVHADVCGKGPGLQAVCRLPKPVPMGAMGSHAPYLPGLQ